MTPFQQARDKYLPDRIKVFFITEAPPAPERNRYFYYEHVRRGDSFFLELIKVLFPEEVNAFETVKQLRAEKTYFLERLQEEGCLLLHAHDTPLPNTTTATRVRTYRESLPQLMATLLRLGKPTTPYRTGLRRGISGHRLRPPRQWFLRDPRRTH